MDQHEPARGSSLMRRVTEKRIVFVPRVIVGFLAWSFVFVSIGVVVLVFETGLKVFGINKKFLCH